MVYIVITTAIVIAGPLFYLLLQLVSILTSGEVTMLQLLLPQLVIQLVSLNLLTTAIVIAGFVLILVSSLVQYKQVIVLIDTKVLRASKYTD